MRTRSEPPLHIAASQINGPAFCVDMHTEEALADGEDLTRLFLLSVWHETPLFSEREQAALAWTEAATLITDGGVSDDLYAEAVQHFSEEGLLNLTLCPEEMPAKTGVRSTQRSVDNDDDARRLA